jgi:hypothetical protein
LNGASQQKPNSCCQKLVSKRVDKCLHLWQKIRATRKQPRYLTPRKQKEF